MNSYERFFSRAALARKPSPIRVLTKIQMVSGPEMISLAGGMPNGAMFPISGLSMKVDGSEIQLSQAQLATALQYSSSLGLASFLRHLDSLRTHYHGESSFSDNIDTCVSTGSQNGLEMLLGSLLNEGDGILTDDPMYPGTKAILRPLGASIIPIKTDGDGMDTDDLAKQIEKFKKSHNLKVIMTVANGGNPTGSTLSLERRHRLLELAHAYDLLVVEDDPYYFLQFDGEQLPSLFELDWNSSQNSFKRVIRSDSFSKIISAGIRIGWITGPKEVIGKLELATQCSTLHCPSLTQVICTELFDKWGINGFEEHIVKVKDFYRNRRNFLVASAEKHLGDLADWDVPKGGLFLWIKLNGIDDTTALIEQKAREANVLLCPGSYFAVDENAPNSYCRVAFSVASEEQMDEAMRRLAELIKMELGN
ncbi:unnamed protein product [Oikopleura dioica]|uniref:Aminotransferase class I/classII large domain-containing protein n=1 Tax=Oikopleura dioica TaxID=34765 RepID=E4XV74_OIKDI|nr:unnamed protein product [Oikopleura dioica]